MPVIKRDRSPGNILTTSLAINFAATILALLLEAVSHPAAPASRIADHFIDSFIYANCIGTLLGFAILIFAPRLVLLRSSSQCILLFSIISVLTFIGSLAAGLTLMAIGVFPAGDYSWIDVHRMGFGFLIAYGIGFSAYFYERVRLKWRATSEQLRVKQLEEERAQKLVVEASLSSLESRIQPHFLFNTLNSISALIQEDPLLAERMVERLAALLRFSLDTNLRNTIPLERELKISVDYLEIEKARFGNRLRYEIDIPDELKTVLVPPFIIQTLVENSLKHAVSLNRKGGEILVKARGIDNQIRIEVWDDGAGFSIDEIIAGHGLDNLRSRLAALFQTKAALEISRKSNFTIVCVSLPDYREAEAIAK